MQVKYFSIILLVLCIISGGCIRVDHKKIDPSIFVLECENMLSELEIEQSKDKTRLELSNSITQIKPPTKKEIQTCQNDTECIIVPKSCSTWNVGKSKAINSKFLEYYYNLLNCEEASSISRFSDILRGYWMYYANSYPIFEDYRPFCDNNNCVINKIPTQQEIYDCFLDAAVLTDDATLCNRTGDNIKCTYEVAKHSKNASLCKDILSRFPICYQDVLCDGNNNKCQAEIKGQIVKDFPETSKSMGEYGICIYETVPRGTISLVLTQEEITNYNSVKYSEFRPSGGGGEGGGTANLNCYITETDAPIFLLTINNLVSHRDVEGSRIIDSFYLNGVFHPYDNNLINLSFRDGMPSLIIFKEDFKNADFNHLLHHDDCTFNESIYDEILEISKKDLNIYMDVDTYLSKNNFFNRKNKCKDILRNNFRIKCLNNYALNNGRFDLCVSLDCKIKTAPNLSVCKDIYPDTKGEQENCKQVISFELAKRTEKESYCDNIPSYYATFEACIKDIAISKSNLDLCNKLPKDSRRFECYTEVAIAANYTVLSPAITRCEDLNPYSVTNFSFNCYKSYAVITGDIRYCEKLGRGTKASECYRDVAVRFNRIDLCDKAGEFEEECRNQK